MKALIFQTMLALLIPGLSNTPKQALTPPANYEYSIKLHSGAPVEWGPVWSYYDNSGVVPSGYDRFFLSSRNDIGSGIYQSIQSMLVPIWSEEPTDNRISLDIRFRNPTPISAYSGVYQIDYGLVSMSGAGPTFDLTIANPTPHGVRLYLDISSGLYNKAFIYSINGLSSGNDTYLYYATLNSFYVPPFANTRIQSYVTPVSIDAFYFDILPISSQAENYASVNYNDGYNEGYTTAYDEFGNFDWLSSLFTTMGDLLAIEILPGITIGLILLIPIVFGVLRFIMGLFR